MPDEPKTEREYKLLKLDHRIPDGQGVTFANNIVVQHDDNAFYLMFFQVVPPLLLGTPEEIQRKAESIDTVPANCVARIAIPASQMRAVATAIMDNGRKHEARPRPEPE